MPQRALPPVLALVTDGMPTDDWKAGLAELEKSTWGKKAIRVAIQIGGSEPNSVLSEFAGNAEFVISVSNPGQLARTMRWASTSVTGAAEDFVANPETERRRPTGVVIDDGDHVWIRLTLAGLVREVTERVVPFVSEQEQDRLNAIIADLAGSSDETLVEGRCRLGTAMRIYAYLLEQG